MEKRPKYLGSKQQGLKSWEFTLPRFAANKKAASSGVDQELQKKKSELQKKKSGHEWKILQVGGCILWVNGESENYIFSVGKENRAL